MEKVIGMLTLAAIKAENYARAAAAKLGKRDGLSTFVEMLILVVSAVVIGGIVLGLGGDTIKEIWATLATRIKDLFNYK